MFFWNSCFFYDPTDVGDLISGSSAFSKPSLNIWKFMVHVLLKPGLENFEHYFTSVWDECNCAVVWAFFGITFLWDLNENWPFPALWPLLSFSDLLAYWVQYVCIDYIWLYSPWDRRELDMTKRLSPLFFHCYDWSFPFSPVLPHSEPSSCHLVSMTLKEPPLQEHQILLQKITFSVSSRTKSAWAQWVNLCCSNICHLFIKQLFIEYLRLCVEVCALCCGKENGELSMTSGPLSSKKKDKTSCFVCGRVRTWVVVFGLQFFFFKGRGEEMITSLEGKSEVLCVF